VLINAAICNFENNGGGDHDLWQRMHDRLASLDLHLLLRQQMWDAHDDGNTLADAAEAVLGMVGFSGREVEVVDMAGLSDHHTVVVRLDRATLTDIRNHPLTRAV
jgi:hypothetical protein